MSLSSRQWRNLLKDLNNNRCILMLGPKLASVEAEGHSVPLLELLSKNLSQELEEEAIHFEPTSSSNLSYIAQRFMSIPKIRRMDLEDEVLQFYKDQVKQIPDIYHILAALPFYLVVNTTPDDYMHRAFKASGKWESQFLHYNFRKEKGHLVPRFSIDAPMVYNLLGTLDDPESLVINEEDQVEFIKNVVKGNPPIPNQIMRHFDERKTYLFLGFDLEKWHFRLLLDSLRLNTENVTISPQLDNYPMTSVTQTFYEDRYQFVFIDEKIDDFLGKLKLEYDNRPILPEQATTVKQAKRIALLHDNNEADVNCRNQLVGHLSTLKQKGEIELWHQGLTDYSEVDTQVRHQINSADLILLLLSADFFASDQINDRELLLLNKRQQENPVKVILILNRACNFEDAEQLKKYPVLPAKDQPIQTASDLDEAYKLIVEQIKTTIYE